MEFGVPDPHFQGMGVWFGPNSLHHHTYPRINVGPRLMYCTLHFFRDNKSERGIFSRISTKNTLFYVGLRET